MRRSILAEERVLETFHCSTEKIPVAVTTARSNEAHNTDHHIEVLVHPSGWKFHSFHRHILNEKERKELAANFRQQLRQMFPSFSTSHPITEEDDDDLHWDNYKLHIPPMLFGRDIMRLDFKNWGSVNVSAQDALFCWLCQHVPEVSNEHALQVIQVPYAKSWTNRLAALPIPGSPSVNNAHHHIQPIHGSVNSIQDVTKSAHAHSQPPPAHTDATLASPASKQHSDHLPITTIKASDWTYSTDYCCSLLHTPLQASAEQENQEEQQFILHGQTFHRSNLYPLHHKNTSSSSLPAAYHTPWTVTPQTTCGIDYELLRRRDVPILFYDEMTLYEDDLEDCGEISVEAKIRVMPNCWFALVRYFLRIDNVIARCRETRLFHVFAPEGSAPTNEEDIKIHVEVLWREKRLNEDAVLFPNTTNSNSSSNTATPDTGSGVNTFASTSTTTATTATTATSQFSPATSAVLRASQGAPVHPALLAAMQASARSTTTSTTSTSHTAVTSHVPHPALSIRYTKENASEVLPQINVQNPDIPAYYTLSLRAPHNNTTTSENSSTVNEEEQTHHRHLHWFGLAAAHGVRK